MKYVSTRDNSNEYNFEEVFIKGLADDGGLYVPTSLKKYTHKELLELKNLSYNELSSEIINQFLSDFLLLIDKSKGLTYLQYFHLLKQEEGVLQKHLYLFYLEQTDQ